jgi:hypothetical protein
MFLKGLREFQKCLPFSMVDIGLKVFIHVFWRSFYSIFTEVFCLQDHLNWGLEIKHKFSHFSVHRCTYFGDQHA